MTIPAPTPTPAPIAVVFIPLPVESPLSFSTVVRDGAGAVVGIVEDVDSLDDVVAEELEVEVSVFLVALGVAEELVVVVSTVDSVELTCLDSFLTQNCPV
jgi:hypothetical protein